MFLDFINLYRKFIKNFNEVAALLTLVLQTNNKSIGNKSQNTLANASKKNQDTSSDISHRNIDGDIKNLLSVIKSVKSKNENFVKVNSFKTEFLTRKAKKIFIYL